MSPAIHSFHCDFVFELLLFLFNPFFTPTLSYRFIALVIPRSLMTLTMAIAHHHRKKRGRIRSQRRYNEIEWTKAEVKSYDNVIFVRWSFRSKPTTIRLFWMASFFRRSSSTCYKLMLLFLSFYCRWWFFGCRWSWLW